MSELEDKQKVYDLTSELEALKPKADSYKQMVTDIVDTVAGYVETSDNPADAYDVVQAIADIIKDGLNITIEDSLRGSFDFILRREMVKASNRISYSLAHSNEHFISSWDLATLYEVELEFGDEDYSVFTTEVGDISEV